MNMCLQVSLIFSLLLVGQYAPARNILLLSSNFLILPKNTSKILANKNKINEVLYILGWIMDLTGRIN